MPAKPKAKPRGKALAPKRTSAEILTAAPATLATSEFAIGDQVSHPTFGKGSVVSLRDDKLTIQFANAGTKEIVASFVTRLR